MKKFVILLLWILVGDKNGSSGRICTWTITIPYTENRAAQLNCGSTTCHFSNCTSTWQDIFNTTCHFDNCTDNTLDQVLDCDDAACQHQVLSLCPIRSIQQECLNVLTRKNRDKCHLLQQICSENPTSNPSSSVMCTTTPIPADLVKPTTISTSQTSSSIISSQANQESQPGQSLIVTCLGVLVGILVVLLAVVTTGWVWTCWTVKRRESNKNNSEQVRTIQNTAYGVIVPANNSPAGQQASSNNDQLGNISQAGGLQGRDIENNYHLMGNALEEEGDEEHEYHVLEGPGGDTHEYQNRELEMIEVTENGEEHAYHVLEGPGGDDASREPGWREVGGIMDYEIPLPLKNK